MKNHYPSIRIHAQSGHLLIRDGIEMTFYMKRSHEECAPATLRALEIYLSAVGPSALDLHTDEDGHWHKIEGSAYEHVQQEFFKSRRLIVELADSSITENRYQFQYHGKP